MFYLFIAYVYILYYLHNINNSHNKIDNKIDKKKINKTIDVENIYYNEIIKINILQENPELFMYAFIDNNALVI